MERLQLHSQAISQGQTVYDYIIVGAGISGVQAADILASKKNTSFLVLEAQPAIGGRIGSIAISGLEEVKKADWVKKNIDKINSVIVEKGATWIEQRHLVLLQLCKQFGITLREQHVHGQGTYLAKEKPYTSSELMKHPEYAETIKLIIEVIDELSVQYNKVVYSDLKVTSPQAKQMLKKYDRMTLTEFLNERIPERLKFVREIFDSFFEHTECYKSADNSMHEVLTKNARSNDLAILKELLGDFGHEPSYLLNGGTSVLITSFIKEIQKKLKKPISDVLKLSHQVITVDNRSKNHTTIICQLPGNVIKKYRCKHVICAVPLTVTRSIAFENISKAKRLIIDNQLISNSKKNFMITKTPFWRRDSNGKPAANGQGLFSNDYLVNFCHDISPPDESCGIMVYFHHGKKLDAWEATYSDQDYEKKRNYFIELMSKIYKVKPEDKARLFDGCIYHDCSYMNDQFIKSGFQSLTRPGTFNQVLEMGDSLEALYRDENGITFVGSEYSLQFASYMQGAVRITRQKVFKLIGEKDPLAHLLVENNLPTQ